MSFTLQIGQEAPDFLLPATDGVNYSLDSFVTYPYLVVFFTCNHCPVAQAYEDRIIALANDYKEKGIELVAINVNNMEEDKLPAMKERAEAKGYKAERIARAEGDAQRFDLIATEYRAAPEVTRKRLYIEAMQQVIGDTPKVIDFTNGKNLLQIPVPGASASAPSATQAAAAGISATEADKGGQ